jgi:hypothetical protein
MHPFPHHYSVAAKADTQGDVARVPPGTNEDQADDWRFVGRRNQ